MHSEADRFRSVEIDDELKHRRLQDRHRPPSRSHPPRRYFWGGINNTFLWIDPTRGIADVIMMLYLPFADARALAVYDAFERGAYQLVKAERSITGV